MGGLGGVLLFSMLGASITGVTVAVIAKAILPGKQRVSGIELFLIGTGAAWLGGFIAGLFGWGDGRGLHWGVLALQVLPRRDRHLLLDRFPQQAGEAGHCPG